MDETRNKKAQTADSWELKKLDFLREIGVRFAKHEEDISCAPEQKQQTGQQRQHGSRDTLENVAIEVDAGTTLQLIKVLRAGPVEIDNSNSIR
jgi:hypothetical protein